MQTKNKCKNCANAVPYGVDSFGKIKMCCKNIFCVFEPIIENIYHTIVLEDINVSENT